jgi:hypothetical protein
LLIQEDKSTKVYAIIIGSHSKRALTGTWADRTFRRKRIKRLRRFNWERWCYIKISLKAHSARTCILTGL